MYGPLYKSNRIECYRYFKIRKNFKKWRHTDSKADFWQAPDTKLQSTDDGNGSKSCNRPDDDYLILRALLNVWIDSVNTTIQLHNAQTKWSAHSKHGTNDAQDVDEVAIETVDEVTKDWIKAGAHGHRQPFPVAQEAQQ